MLWWVVHYECDFAGFTHSEKKSFKLFNFMFSPSFLQHFATFQWSLAYRLVQITLFHKIFLIKERGGLDKGELGASHPGHRLQNISLHFHQEARGNTREKELKVMEWHIFCVVYQKYMKTAVEGMDKLCFNFGLNSDFWTKKYLPTLFIASSVTILYAIANLLAGSVFE